MDSYGNLLYSLKIHNIDISNNNNPIYEQYAYVNFYQYLLGLKDFFTVEKSLLY